MASIVMKEAYKSRGGGIGQSNSFDLSYFVFNDDLSFLDEIAATDYALANRPSSYRGLDYLSYKIDDVVLGVYSIVLTYGTNQYQTTTGTSSLQFNIGGGMSHITTSLSKTDYRDSSVWAWAADFKGAIGVDLGQDGKNPRVNGVDIVAPIFEYSYQSLFEADAITDAYQETLFNLCGKVNNATFNNRPAGTVLFKGCHGSRKGEDKWELTFDFAYSPNATSLVIGGISVTTKNGWDYLDVIYVQKGTANGLPLMVPAQATVHKVYSDGDFSVLGI